MNNKKPYLKTLKQSNHESTIIPESVSQYNDQPLYIIIALWCLQQKRWINRNDIAQAFYMTARRASFQLSYITKKPKRIFFRFRQKEITKKKNRSICNEIWVEKIVTESAGHDMEQSPSKDNKTGRRVMGAYRNRVGNGMSGSGSIWHTLEIIRRSKEEGKDE
ncbi:TPA: CaiF/GrlA family transcriptional regulator [Salmonella enterica]|uniref:CaiF/GrlA family transcriptional regulator n=1 Tax=Salmonella sp. 14 TaxID=1179812 RepID=I3W324_9ENTR|nr:MULTISPECIES: CaiF/GrlA family transcriptional regulator [Salmonella]EAY2125335.1 CaiF/GrlA family transcriptional regulator [Salmonella enterica]EDS5478509.1 CaiF/GrlA family transcriptional regulator [Salmonella enterica subsp. enterica]AFK90001.1 hypothetical protein [Salmonella sp. 14]ASD99226.1 CaiF/GrlA family transcriptional regulator [Salmonella enterica subsp. enterica serovar Onderstepoort str. SA20060086]EAY2195395.1 CaiF/GrlA family transcriptional regulator [Salmonella enterica